MSEQTEKRNVAIPESIELNGVTYSVKETPELQSFIQEISKVERAKLYSQMDNLKEQINKLSQADVTPSTPLDIDALVKALQRSFVTPEYLKEQLKSTMTEVVTPMLKATEENKRAELEAYRQELINKNIAVCIPDLVVGNSKEELDAALQKSIKLRSAYPQPTTAEKTMDPLLRKQAQQITETPTSVDKTSAKMPEVPKVQSPDSTIQPDLKKLTPQEFAKQREALKQSIESMYGG